MHQISKENLVEPQDLFTLPLQQDGAKSGPGRTIELDIEFWPEKDSVGPAR